MTERIRAERRRPFSVDRRAEASVNYEELRSECVVLVFLNQLFGRYRMGSIHRMLFQHKPTI
jgi:hypothetical protein